MLINSYNHRAWIQFSLQKLNPLLLNILRIFTVKTYHHEISSLQKYLCNVLTYNTITISQNIKHLFYELFTLTWLPFLRIPIPVNPYIIANIAHK